MTSVLVPIDREEHPWSSLPSDIKDAPVSCKWIGADGRVWPLTGLDAGAEGAFVTGDIDGIVHIPFESVWTSPAYGAPRFERTVDARREIAFQLGLYSDTSLGWYDTEARWWNGCQENMTGYFSITTLRHGELWLPMQLLETPKAALPDDPGRNRVAIHNIVLAVDGDPRWRRPDCMPPPWRRPSGSIDKGIIHAVNRGTEPAWPIWFLDAPGQIYLPDGPNAIASDRINPLDDWPKLAELFGIPFVDAALGTFTRSRDAEMIKIPKLKQGEHALIDTDPTHRIAITVLDAVDNVVKRYIRSAALLDWLSGHYGADGLPLIQRFEGRGFSVPIPPRSVATFPVQHSRAGGQITVHVPQRFRSALA